MSLYPDIQKKAQAELDAIIGHDRLPDLDDRDTLPYLKAIIKESLRWLPVAPLGQSHYTMVDDEFAGYFIPAGTIVQGNIWYVFCNAETGALIRSMVAGAACTILKCTTTPTNSAPSDLSVTASWIRTSWILPRLCLDSVDGESFCTPAIVSTY